jgi:hypothetical protein
VDRRAHECARTQGLRVADLAAGAPPRTPVRGFTAPTVLRALPLLAGIVALASASAGGLARLGLIDVELLAAPTRLHAALMISGFLGTVISLERAVALRCRWAFAAPLASAAGVVLALAGLDVAALLAWLTASAVLVAASMAIVQRQPVLHTKLLLVAALAWLVGNLLMIGANGFDAVLLAWFDFLILTIAAERLELTRLMRRRPSAQPLLVGIVALLLTGTAVTSLEPVAGHLMHGAALLALAAWLFTFDLAPRTLWSTGVARYAALCLLGGYAWLAVAGSAQIAFATGAPAARDVLVHALGLGFVVSMIFGHAPIIVPAVARLPIAFGTFFYLPLALLHGSLLVRVAGAVLPAWRSAGAQFNVAALLLFIACMLAAAGIARRRASLRPVRRRG